jgi:hypothetical protein
MIASDMKKHLWTSRNTEIREAMRGSSKKHSFAVNALIFA